MTAASAPKPVAESEEQAGPKRRRPTEKRKPCTPLLLPEPRSTEPETTHASSASSQPEPPPSVNPQVPPRPPSQAPGSPATDGAASLPKQQDPPRRYPGRPRAGARTRPSQQTHPSPLRPPPTPLPHATPFEESLLPAPRRVIGPAAPDGPCRRSARVEDRVEARVARDVRGGSFAVPAGARARGNVTLVETGGKFKERARLGVRFHTLVLADGTESDPDRAVYREGGEFATRDSAKIGGAAAAGALIGAIFGGGKGAAIGVRPAVPPAPRRRWRGPRSQGRSPDRP